MTWLRSTATSTPHSAAASSRSSMRTLPRAPGLSRTASSKLIRTCGMSSMNSIARAEYAAPSISSDSRRHAGFVVDQELDGVAGGGSRALPDGPRWVGSFHLNRAGRRGRSPIRVSSVHSAFATVSHPTGRVYGRATRRRRAPNTRVAPRPPLSPTPSPGLGALARPLPSLTRTIARAPRCFRSGRAASRKSGDHRRGRRIGASRGTRRSAVRWSATRRPRSRPRRSAAASLASWRSPTRVDASGQAFPSISPTSTMSSLSSMTSSARRPGCHIKRSMTPRSP